nr:Tol-Pal system beta propeller repeat protein TolB [uncultured Halomonas sp.]
MKPVFAMLTALLLLVSNLAKADLTIEITQGSDRAVPIAIVPFAQQGQANLPENIAEIVRNDLAHSGQFSPLADNALIARPHSSEQVNYRDWRAVDSNYLVVGQVTPEGSDYRIQFELLDIYGERRMLGEVVTVGQNQLRSAAHYISDQVFEAVTDIRGAFSTKIAYVTAEGAADSRRYGLHIADADGHNSQQILTSDEPIMSPAWSPDGNKLAYTSFETGRPAIYVQNLANSQRVQVTSFQGINGAATWSPDGRKLAMSLSKDGQPEIYTMDIAAGNFQRLTNNSAIDTEPDWSPDGESLLFTSDRSGGPQLYRYDLSSGEAKRITFTGNYNSRGRFSPVGEDIFMIHRASDGYHVAKKDMKTDRLTVLTETRWDESPSVAPNGSMIIFATQEGNRGVLGVVSADGKASYRLPSAQGDVREPAWSPFLN